MYVQFGPWLPDHPDLGKEGLAEAVNVIPTAGGYRPFPQLAAISPAALPARPLGAVSAFDPSGNALTFAGTANALYQFVSLSFTDVSLVGGYSTAATETWEFTAYQNLLIAANYTDDTQVWTLGTSTAFAVLSASAPKARTVAAVRDFVVFGNVNDGAIRPYRVRWGPIGDPTGDYAPHPSTQADFQDLASGGHVQKIVGGEVGTIIMQRSIWRMTYVGGLTVFQFDEVAPKRGTVAKGSVAVIGQMIFFLDEDGLYMWDGGQAVPIGDERTDRTLLSDLDAANYGRISSTIDPVNRLYLMAYPGAGNPGGQPNRIFLYHWPTGKAAIIEAGVEIIAQLLTTAYTLEQLDVFGSIDTLPASLDSRLWAGGAILMSAFGTDYRLSSFTGNNAAATLTTGEFEPIEHYRTILFGLRPLIQGEVPTVSIGVRNRQVDPIAWSGPYAVNGIGKIEPRLNARYMRVRLNMSAGLSWDHAMGVQINDKDMASGGER